MHPSTPLTPALCRCCTGPQAAPQSHLIGCAPALAPRRAPLTSPLCTCPAQGLKLHLRADVASSSTGGISWTLQTGVTSCKKGKLEAAQLAEVAPASAAPSGSPQQGGGAQQGGGTQQGGGDYQERLEAAKAVNIKAVNRLLTCKVGVAAAHPHHQIKRAHQQCVWRCRVWAGQPLGGRRRILVQKLASNAVDIKAVNKVLTCKVGVAAAQGVGIPGAGAGGGRCSRHMLMQCTGV